MRMADENVCTVAESCTVEKNKDEDSGSESVAAKFRAVAAKFRVVAAKFRVIAAKYIWFRVIGGKYN
eukprot:Em0006g52a